MRLAEILWLRIAATDNPRQDILAELQLEGRRMATVGTA
jgi:hypothetical protein